MSNNENLDNQSIENIEPTAAGLAALIEICRQVEDMETAQLASTRLRQLANEETLPQLWRELPAVEPGLRTFLEQVRRDLDDYQGYFPPPSPTGLWLMMVARANRPALVAEMEPELVEIILKIAAETNPQFGTTLRQLLSQLATEAAREKLCELALAGGPLASAAMNIAGAANYAPRDPYERALFYFLSGQLERYEGFDFDHSLLRFMYEFSDEATRRRILEKARQSGQGELVLELIVQSRATGFTQARLGEMTVSEWQTILNLLSAAGRWADLWKLAQQAPAVWTVQILRLLNRQKKQWLPDTTAEQNQFKRLLRLAHDCLKQGQLTLNNSLVALGGWQGNQEPVGALAFSSDGQILATGSHHGQVRLWELATGRLLAEHDLTIEPSKLVLKNRPKNYSGGPLINVVSLSFVKPGLLLCIYQYHWSSQWVTLLGAVELQIESDYRQIKRGTDRSFGNSSGAGHLLMATDTFNQWLAFSNGENFVQIWKIPDLEYKRHITGYFGEGYYYSNYFEDDYIYNQLGEVNCLALKSAPDWLVVGDMLGRVIAYYTPSEKPRSNYAYEPAFAYNAGGPVTAVALARDENVIASSNQNGQIYILAVPETGWYGQLVCLQQFEVVQDEVTALAVSPDGRYTYSGHESGAVYAWDNETGQQIADLGQLPGEVQQLAISPAGNYVVCGSSRGVRVWTSRLQQIANLPAETTSVDDLFYVQAALKDGMTSRQELPWLRLVELLLNWRYRHEIELGEVDDFEIGDFDIELG